MIVPSSRLLVISAAIVLPAAVVSILPSWHAAAYAVIAAFVVTAAADAGTAGTRLQGIRLFTPETIRLWKDREGSFDLTIRNQSGRARQLRLGIVFPQPVSTQTEEIRTVLPQGAELSRISWSCISKARGRYSVNQCAVETRSFLGLWFVRGKLPVQLEIRVYPNLAAERRNSAVFLKRGPLGVHLQRQIGKGREFEKLREYAAGDSFDEIDWKATARRGHPITRVFQIERTQEVYVIIDASRLSARPLVDEPDTTILERNVTAALLLALAAEKQGDRFGLITFSDSVHSFVRARNGKAHYGACQDALYTLQPRTVTPDFDEVFALLRLKLRRRALLIFLTQLDDAMLAESFLKNVNLIRRQHLVLVGMAKPAGAQALFEDTRVNNTDEIYEKLAGHMLWGKLRQLAKTLERLGVHFSLLDAGNLPLQLASLYLNVKQRQLL